MTSTQDIRDIVIANIRRFREASGKTKVDLCASIGMSRAYWDDVEAGQKDPSLSTLERMAQALGVTVSDLLTEPPKSGKKRSA